MAVKVDRIFHRLTSKLDRAKLRLKSLQLLMSCLLWQERCQHTRTTHAHWQTHTNTWPTFQAGTPSSNNSQKDINKQPKKTKKTRSIRFRSVPSWQIYFTRSVSLLFHPLCLILYFSFFLNTGNLIFSFPFQRTILRQIHWEWHCAQAI